MAYQSTFPLSLICSVSVQEAQAAVSGPQFNLGLVLGSSPVIPSYGTDYRVREYTSTLAMQADGFSSTDPEVIAATQYFSNPNNGTPPTTIAIGRLDLTAVQTIVPTTGELGTGYAVGDTFSIVQSGASYGVGQVLTVGTGGTVLTANVKTGGTAYEVASGLSTTALTGSGTGLEVDITAVGETPVQAITACRSVSPSWYWFNYPQGTAADHVNLATWAAQTDLNSYYLWADGEAEDITTATTDPFSIINAESLDRNFGVYTTTQSSTYPNNPYESAAIMGTMAGLNTGLSGSAFSMLYKTLVGISEEPIDDTALTNLTAKSGNAYISIANSFFSLWPGVGAGGKAPDEQLFIDYLVSNIQYAIGNAFTAYPKVPQTDPGQQLLITPTKQQCANMQTIGFIAPSGVWTGEDISVLGLTNGSSLPLGYKVASPQFSTQLAADRAAFKMMPIYVAFIEAGSGRSVAIQITVQR